MAEQESSVKKSQNPYGSGAPSRLARNSISSNKSLLGPGVLFQDFNLASSTKKPEEPRFAEPAQKKINDYSLRSAPRSIVTQWNDAQKTEPQAGNITLHERASPMNKLLQRRRSPSMASTVEKKKLIWTAKERENEPEDTIAQDNIFGKQQNIFSQKTKESVPDQPNTQSQTIRMKIPNKINKQSDHAHARLLCSVLSRWQKKRLDCGVVALKEAKERSVRRVHELRIVLRAMENIYYAKIRSLQGMAIKKLKFVHLSFEPKHKQLPTKDYREVGLSLLGKVFRRKQQIALKTLKASSYEQRGKGVYSLKWIIIRKMRSYFRTIQFYSRKATRNESQRKALLLLNSFVRNLSRVLFFRCLQGPPKKKGFSSAKKTSQRVLPQVDRRIEAELKTDIEEKQSRLSLLRAEAEQKSVSQDAKRKELQLTSTRIKASIKEQQRQNNALKIKLDEEYEGESDFSHPEEIDNAEYMKKLTGMYVKLRMSKEAQINAEEFIGSNKVSMEMDASRRDWLLMRENSQLKGQIAVYEGREPGKSEARVLLVEEREALATLLGSYVRERYYWQWVRLLVEAG